MTNFKEIFENPNQKYFKTPGTRIRPKRRTRMLKDEELDLIDSHFERLPKDETQIDRVSFDTVKLWLLQYPEFMVRYNLDADNLNIYFEKQRTQIPELFTREQFEDFLLEDRICANPETNNFEYIKSY